MSKRIEKIMKEYPQRTLELRCLKNQIKTFTGISDKDFIETMQFAKPEGERVQTSNISDKTAKIALSYENKMNRINDGWYRHLIRKHDSLQEELNFFELSMQSLSGRLPEIITDMIINDLTWDEISDKYDISRTMIAKHRKKAICELEELYNLRDQELADYMLS